MKKRAIIGIILSGMLTSSVTVIALGCGVCGCSATPRKTAATAKKALKAQTACPVMGGKINKNIYADVKGLRIYACCAGCVPKIKANPDKHIEKIKANGETPEKAPVILCGKCGEIKGRDKCCRKDAKKCVGCGLIKGSPGCCKLPKAGEDAELCPKCGEIKATAKCCKADAAKCPKCGLTKGSPGCCKLPQVPPQGLRPCPSAAAGDRSGGEGESSLSCVPRHSPEGDCGGLPRGLIPRSRYRQESIESEG